MTIWQPKLDTARRPLYAAIVDALAHDTARGRLIEGERLPTHRELSAALGLSLGTVTRAYREAERRGIIRGEVGRGTFVAGGASRPNPLAPVDAAFPRVIDLGVSWPMYSEDPDLSAALTRLAARPDVRHLLRYQPNQGMARHRRAGARWVARFGFEVDPDRVLVCVGTQHALTVSLSLLLEPGETLLTEVLTYPGVKAVADFLHLKLQGVPIDKEGLLPDAFAAACRQRRAKVLYCVPAIHNPTTGTMSEDRRREIAAVAEEYGVTVVEDGVHYPLATTPAPPIASFAPERTFLIAGLAKPVCGGLRVAYLVTPRQAVEELGRRIWATSWMAPPLPAEIAAMWIEDGTADRTVQCKRREAAARLDVVRDVFEDLPFRAAPHGFHIWLELPDRWSSEGFAAATFRRGAAVTSAEAFTAGTQPPPAAVRICTSAAEDRSSLERGLRIIRGAMTGDRGVGAAIV